jgi:hypothetical protein
MEQNNQDTHIAKTQYCTLTMRYKFLSSSMNIKVEFGQNESLLKLYGYRDHQKNRTGCRYC